jgi:DNA polymerase-1
MAKTLYLIDGHAQIFRAYHAIRSLSSPVTQEPTNATFGFVGMLLKLYREYDPDYIVVTLDVSGDTETFRSQLDPEYKATRSAPPEDLHPQTERITEICGLMGIPVYGVPGYEADDVIATICAKLADERDVEVRIVSRDKDLQQLLGERVVMFDIHKDELADAAKLAADKGITPAQVVDVLALMGDTVDNVPGVQGVGPKTAAKWTAEYGSIEGLLENLDALTAKQREKVEAARDRLDLNRKLVTLVADVPMDFSLAAAAVTPLNIEALGPMFKQLGFHRHLADVEAITGRKAPAAPKPAPAVGDDFGGLFGGTDEADSAAPEPRPSAISREGYRCITTRAQLDEVVSAVGAAGVVSVDTETTGLRPLASRLCGVCLAWPDEGSTDDQMKTQSVYIPVLSPEPSEHLDAAAVLEALRPILTDPAITKVGQNLKFDTNVLRHAGLAMPLASDEAPASPEARPFDTLIASFLIDSERSSHKLDYLSLAYLNHEMIPIADLLGTGKKQITFDQVPLDKAVTYAAEDADVALRLRAVLAPKLKAMGLRQLFDDLEMPLVEVLAELEYNGILVDPDELDRQNAAMDERIGELRRSIIDTAGVDFNPDSPRQLADVLFNELGCTVVKRRKTGPSTDSEVLQRIVDEQAGPGAAIAEMVLEYRMMTKLRGTYLESLKQAIHPGTGRIHASFNQTGAATGRLSSSDPNLQNIPIRTEMGRQIRKAFIAPPGCVLLSADYSQIELRLLAHLSQDPALIEAFVKDVDIHTAVASEVFGIPIEEVTRAQRDSAKMVNFGIVYGITPFGLARRLARTTATAGDDVTLARQIIDDYKKRYPKIDAFLDRCVEQAETRGYVETICKRRRLIPQIASRNNNLVQLGRRMAINSVVQGSAADLIKLAMLKLKRQVTDRHAHTKMLVQIHDEVLFQIPGDQVDERREQITDAMEDAMALAVPLKVQTAWGGTWYDCK